MKNRKIETVDIGNIEIGKRPEDLNNLRKTDKKIELDTGFLQQKLNEIVVRLKKIQVFFGTTNKIITNEDGWMGKKNYRNKNGDRGENGQGDNENKEINKKLNKKGQERRALLKLAGKVTMGIIVGEAVGKFTGDVLKKEGLMSKDYGAGSSDGELGQGLESEIVDKKNIENKQGIEDVLEEQGQKEEVVRKKEEVNYRSLKKKLRDQYLIIGNINIVDIKKTIEKYWLQKYDLRGNQHLGLKESLVRMTEWHNEVQDIFDNVFQQKGLKSPHWLIYLGIAESHWTVKKNQDSTSWAGAAGVFQLMPSLARSYGLRVDDYFDERYDVIKNSKVAAEYLADLYKRVAKNMNIIPENENDWGSDIWKLVLALYNGGYVSKFFKWADENRQLVNYDNYLQFREKRMQNFLDDRLKAKSIIYKVKSGDSLFKIARRYKGVTVEEIITENNLQNNNIQPGQHLKITFPEKSLKQKREELEKMFKFQGKLFSALENLNYPEKFIGILEAIKKNGLFIKNDNDTIEHKYEETREDIPWLGGLNKKP